MELTPKFHARAIYHHLIRTHENVTLIVYSTNHSTHPFELHISTELTPIRGRKSQIISDWRRKNQQLHDDGFARDSLDIVDHDFDL